MKRSSIKKTEDDIAALRKKLAEERAKFRDSIGGSIVRACGDDDAETVAEAITDFMQTGSASELVAAIKRTPTSRNNGPAQAAENTDDRDGDSSVAAST